MSWTSCACRDWSGVSIWGLSEGQSAFSYFQLNSAPQDSLLICKHKVGVGYGCCLWLSLKKGFQKVGNYTIICRPCNSLRSVSAPFSTLNVWVIPDHDQHMITIYLFNCITIIYYLLIEVGGGGRGADLRLRLINFNTLKEIWSLGTCPLQHKLSCIYNYYI